MVPNSGWFNYNKVHENFFFIYYEGQNIRLWVTFKTSEFMLEKKTKKKTALIKAKS